MARERKVSERAVTNMIAFLNDLKSFSGSTGGFSVTGLAKQHHVSQTAATAVKELRIITMVEDSRNWVYVAKEPDRKLALIVLDSQLQKNKPGAYTPLFPDMAKIVTLLEEISAKLSSTPQIENNGLESFKTGENVLLKIVAGIASNIYDYDNLGLIVHSNSHQPTNALILTVAEDLLKQYNEKFK